MPSTRPSRRTLSSRPSRATTSSSSSAASRGAPTSARVDGLRAARAHDRPRLQQAGEVLARLQVAEEDDVGRLQAVLGARRGGRVVVGREAGRDAVGDDLDAVEREPGHGVDEVEARVLGADHDPRGAPHRPRHEAPERGPVGERHEALVAQVGDVVHRQHGRAGQRRRQHVEPVVERRPVGAQPHRQGRGGARVVRSDRHAHRHDAPALGDLRRQRGGIAQVGQDAERRVEPRERGEHVDREGLVARAPAADDVGVERDDRRHAGQGRRGAGVRSRMPFACARIGARFRVVPGPG